MRRPLIAVVLVLAALAVVITSSLSRRSHEVIPWRTDFHAAELESRNTGKPMLLDFTAEWCGPCQDMRRTTWSDAAVARAVQGYVPVQIDLDEHKDLASQFGVAAIPHLAILDKDGRILASQEGELPPGEFQQWLASVHAEATPPATANTAP